MALFGAEIIIPIAIAGGVALGAAYKARKRKIKFALMVFEKSLLDFESSHINEADIPTVFQILLNRIDPDGVKEERIFRAVGNLDNINRLRRAFDREKEEKVKIAEEPFDDIACLLKIWLRLLPEALILPDTVNSLIELNKREPKAENAAYKEILLQLPDRNYLMLKMLMRTLHLIAKYSPINNMTPEDLAYAFGPYLVHPSIEGKKPPEHETKEEKKERENKEHDSKKEKKDKDKKEQKEREKQFKEEKVKKKEQKCILEIETLGNTLHLMELPYDNSKEIQHFLAILIENQPDVFVDANLQNCSRSSMTRSNSSYSRN